MSGVVKVRLARGRRAMAYKSLDCADITDESSGRWPEPLREPPTSTAHSEPSSSAPRDEAESNEEGAQMCLPLWFNLASYDGTAQETVAGIPKAEVVHVCHWDGPTFLAIAVLTAPSFSKAGRVC